MQEKSQHHYLNLNMFLVMVKYHCGVETTNITNKQKKEEKNCFGNGILTLWL